MTCVISFINTCSLSLEAHNVHCLINGTVLLNTSKLHCGCPTPVTLKLAVYFFFCSVGWAKKNNNFEYLLCCGGVLCSDFGVLLWCHSPWRLTRCSSWSCDSTANQLWHPIREECAEKCPPLSCGTYSLNIKLSCLLTAIKHVFKLNNKR